MSGNLGCVVVAVDGSEESMYALNWALNNLKLKPPPQRSDDEVVEGSSDGAGGGGGYFVLLHVQSPPSIAAGISPGAIPFGGPSDLEVPAISAAIEAHQRRITEAVFERALQICAGREVNVKTQMVVGKPKEAICEAVENLHADLLVMGSHSYGPIKRMFLGSVSNYCNSQAQCPVIVVKDIPEKKA